MKMTKEIIHRKCDLCNAPARYDDKTRMGPWAYLCENHQQEFGCGIGTVLRKETDHV